MNPKLFRIIIPVTNIEDACSFYSKLLQLEGKRVSPGRHYFNCGGTILACYDPISDGDKNILSPNSENIYISVQNLEECFEIAKKLECQWLEGEIKLRAWGERSFYAKDPFNNQICLVDEDTVFTG